MKYTHQNGVMTVFILILIGSTTQYEKTGFIESPQQSHNQNNTKASIQDYETEWVDSYYKRITPKFAKSKRQSFIDFYADYSQYNFPSMKLLDTLTITCKSPNSAINSFKFLTKGTKKDDKKQIGFKYSCVTSPAITDNCVAKQTEFYKLDFMIKKSVKTLGKFSLECKNDEVMKDFDMVTSGSFRRRDYLFKPKKYWPKLSYRYTCCKANISLIVHAKNARTKNKNNSLEMLSKQYVNARDLNVLNRIALTTPGRYIAYEYRIAILNGEDSPTFSYKFDPATHGTPNKKTIPSFIGN